MKLVRTLCFIIAVMTVVSCGKNAVSVGTTAFVDKQALPSGFPAGTVFAVIPAETDNPLLSKEIAQKIEHYLYLKGYNAGRKVEADYLLYFTTKTEGKEKLVSVPRYVPGETQTTYGIISHKGLGESQVQSYTQGSGTTVYTPEQRTLYTSSLHIDVFGRSYEKEGMKEHASSSDPLWSGSAAFSGNAASDIRVAIDYLIVTVFKYFGVSSGQNQHVELESESPDLELLKR